MLWDNGMLQVVVTQVHIHLTLSAGTAQPRNMEPGNGKQHGARWLQREGAAPYQRQQRVCYHDMYTNNTVSMAAGRQE